MICFMQIFVTHPYFEEVIIYDDAKPIFGEKGPIPDEPPSYDMKAVTKRNKAQLKMIRHRRDSNPGPLGQKSNALTTEPKNRLPGAVVRD